MTSAITIFSRAFIACAVSILLALAFQGLAEGVFGLHGMAAYATSALAALVCGFGATFALVGGPRATSWKSVTSLTVWPKGISRAV